MLSRSRGALCRHRAAPAVPNRRSDRCVGGRAQSARRVPRGCAERVRSLDGGAIEWDERATMKIPGSGRSRPCPLRSRAPSAGWWLWVIRPTIRRSGRVSPGWAKPPHWPSSWSLKAGSSPSSCNRRSVARILQTRTPVPSGCAGCQRSLTRSGSNRSQPRFLARRWPVPASRSAPNSRWRRLPISRMRLSALVPGRWRCRPRRQRSSPRTTSARPRCVISTAPLPGPHQTRR